MEQVPDSEQVSSSRIRLLLNLGSFQLKLLLDWLRDLLLAPASFIVVIYGIIAGGSQPDKYYNRLMAFGRRTDRFINLFDEYSGASDATAKRSDDYIAPYKDHLIAQAENSELTKKANALVDGLVTSSKTDQPTLPPSDTHSG